MTDKAKVRKETPVFSGVLNYFPDAIKEVAKVSFSGNEQHNPGSELHWDRSKSGDEKDALTRHLLDAGTIDDDGMRHSAKVAWRALAMLQKEIEREEQEAFEERIIAFSKEEDNMYPEKEEDELLLEDLPGSVDYDLASIARYEEEEVRERRMRHIGQNGNDGLHYGLEEDGTGFVTYPNLSAYPESNWTENITSINIKGAKITIDEV